MKGNLKKVEVQCDLKSEDVIVIVTSAKHIERDDVVAVAGVGAIVPAGADEEDGTVVK